MKKYQLKELQTEIKERAVESRSFNPKIQASSGSDRHALRCSKKGLSYKTRVKLLAYGMLRGLPYSCMERNAECLPSFKPIHEEAVRFKPDLTVEECEKWLLAVFEQPSVEAAQ